MSRRFEDFLREWLPPPPSRVLEVGAGQGDLAVSLKAAGYDILAIDPAAPQGEIFRRLKLADLDPEEAGRFEAVIAANVLHHVTDLEPALDRIASLLEPGGLLLVDELAWELLDEQTADWLHGQQRALAAARGAEVPPTVGALREEWASEHVGLHDSRALRAALRLRYEERTFEPAPYLWRFLEGPSTEVLESALVDAGAIQPLGWHWAGTPR